MSVGTEPRYRSCEIVKLIFLKYASVFCSGIKGVCTSYLFIAESEANELVV